MMTCAAAVLALAADGCGNMLSGLVGTQIVVRTSRRSLREQVLGSYDEIGDEVWALAGVRSVDPISGETKPPPSMTESERRALEARRSMEFNRDDVTRFKREGYVGEGRDARLHSFPEQREKLRAQQPWLLSLVEAIVAEENEDRAKVIERIVETTPELKGEEGRRTVARILAEKYRREAEPGMRVQQPDGTWMTVGESGPGE